MTLNAYLIDAFTNQAFGGNPAVVVPMDKWRPDETLLNMAQQHNQSETAYFIPSPTKDFDYHLRWFTPVDEVDLCGHATLASASVIFNQFGCKADTVRFFAPKEKYILTVRKAGDWLELDFPVRVPQKVEAPSQLLKFLNVPAEPVEILRTERDWYIVYADEDAIRNAQPDMGALAKEKIWQCITAPGKTSDFVSRFFTASGGMSEDPVTGSTHCALIPYWAKRLGKTKMMAEQVSRRGGVLKVELAGDRVKIAGQTRLYAQMIIHL